MASITVGDDALGRAVSLISAYAGHPLGQPALGASTSATTSDGTTVKGLAACATALAVASAAAAHLLGSTPVEQAQVSEWLTWCTTELALLLDDKLAKVNEWLQGRTYLVGGRLTLADLAVFGTVQPAVAAMPGAQTDQFCCLLRWFDLLQHVADPRQSVFKHRALPLPRYVPPPLPAAPAPSTSGKGDAKGSDASTATKGGDAAGKAAPAASSSTAAAPAAAAAGGKEAGGGKADKKAKKGGGDAAAAADAAGGAAADGASSGKKAGGGGKEASSGGGGDEPRIDMLDIRVGQIVKIGRHPNADSLYLEEIDLGEDKPRQVISGLVKFVPEDKMEGRRVVVVTNLKPAKMRDVMSYGMVLCASNDAHDTVDPIIPPEGVPVGERIAFEGYSNAPLPEVNPKKKILERILPDLTTDASGNPVYKGVPFMTSKGPVTSTIPNAHVG